ncbi:outer membrane beta-barrel protein [Alteromonas sp. BMJM2]|uniref:outer membrane beta-barrel protein n=1 Tax=Alteromonas sp. BMJM2 TaxID=2954241 RepID=UPI0022B3D7E1|nr:outer membrane beta-barrel protein [Alteromonas sp. BMJM2]
MLSSNLQKQYVACCFAIALAPVLAQAQDEQLEANGMLAGLNVAYKNDSNVQRNGLGQSDNIFSLSPEIAYANYFGKHALSVGYKGDYSRFSKQSNLNFENHNLLAGVEFDHSLRFTSKVSASFQKGVEDPSQVNSLINNFDEFTEYEKTAINGEVAYGRQESIGQVVIGVDVASADFDNNQQEFRNVDSVGAYSQFYYRVAPNTRAVFEVSYYDYKYDEVESFQNLSSEQISVLAGVEWRYSEQLSSSFRAGYQTKQFEDESLNDVNGLSFALDVDWQLSELARISATGSRSANESTIAGLPERVSTSFSIDAQHELSQKLTAYSSIGHTLDDFGVRSDTNNNATLGLTYRLKSWVNVTLEYEYQKRDSDFENFSYNANVVMLSFEMAID